MTTSQKLFPIIFLNFSIQLVVSFEIPTVAKISQYARDQQRRQPCPMCIPSIPLNPPHPCPIRLIPLVPPPFRHRAVVKLTYWLRMRNSTSGNEAFNDAAYIVGICFGSTEISYLKQSPLVLLEIVYPSFVDTQFSGVKHRFIHRFWSAKTVKTSITCLHVFYLVLHCLLKFCQQSVQ